MFHRPLKLSTRLAGYMPSMGTASRFEGVGWGAVGPKVCTMPTISSDARRLALSASSPAGTAPTALTDEIASSHTSQPHRPVARLYCRLAGCRPSVFHQPPAAHLIASAP